MSILNPLTSKNAKFETIDSHEKAFHKLKELLISTPLYCHTIDPRATKLIFVDAATDSSNNQPVLGAVLCQLKNCEDDTPFIPDYININHPIHRVIYDFKLPFQPIPVLSLPLSDTLKPRFDMDPDDDPLYGFTVNNLHDSLFISTILILHFYGCRKYLDLINLKSEIIKIVKKTPTFYSKLCDEMFNSNNYQMKEFLTNFISSNSYPDTYHVMIKSLALFLKRPIWVLLEFPNTDNFHYLKYYTDEYRTPPLILGELEVQGKKIYLPFVQSKNTEVNLTKFKDRLQIIGYFNKTLPYSNRARPIIELEGLAVMLALKHFRKCATYNDTYLLTDARVMYHIFNKQINDTISTTSKWALKISTEYPNLKLRFIRGS